MNVTTRSSRSNIAEEGAGAPWVRPFVDRAFDAAVGGASLVLAEWAIVAWSARAEFAGPWELKDSFVGLVPITWVLTSIGAALGALLLGAARSDSRRARFGGSVMAAAIAALIGVGVTRGRHFASLDLRVTCIALLATVVLFAVYRLLPLLARRVDVSPGASAVVFALVALMLSFANGYVLPRLYPAFHLGLALLTAMCAAPIGRGLRAAIGAAPEGTLPVGPGLTFVALIAAVISAPRAARDLRRSDNVRLVFLDRAPLLGLGVELGARLVPAESSEASSTVIDERPEGRSAIDWRGHDIVLLTIDALRADHVGAYGYARKTTPAIDRLASEGTLFERAYCSTPHTSYSVSSLMTGKNLRPLLAQGLGADSDTLAEILRTYGYRTAAFYPPAVFFIDEELFAPFRDRHLDFEYARVEFADPAERARAVGAYLHEQRSDQRLFLWVHLFEPHEPYVAHPEHVFGERDIDRYDGEIALADAGIGEMVKMVRAARPNAVIVLTADHGEEFGDHRGRYHGTTVYEEQVRVPLIVAGPGVAAARRVTAPVQTIDLLPTMLSALDIPRPPRVFGHDLGRWMRDRASVAVPQGENRNAHASSASAPHREAHALSTSAEGETHNTETRTFPAVAETDDQILLAEDAWRLVCARRAGACALYDLDRDPDELRDVASANEARFQKMKVTLRQIENAQGHYEMVAAHAGGARPWPVAIRRGLAGDADAALEIAGLLDDSDVTFRRQAADVLFDLKRPETIAPLRLAAQRDDDEHVRQSAALALARLGESSPTAIELLNGANVDARRRAALALAENGDARGAGVLTAWWQTGAFPFLRARDILGALAKIRAKDAVPALIASLDDVRLRPHVAATLAAIGNPAARGPLAERFANERQKDTRAALAEALVSLGATTEWAPALLRFLGTPDPLPDGLDLARRAGLLPALGGASEAALAPLRAPTFGGTVRLSLPGAASRGQSAPVPAEAPLRVLLRAGTGDGLPGWATVKACQGEGDKVGAVQLDFPDASPRDKFGALAPGAAIFAEKSRPAACLDVKISGNLVVEALAVVPLADELPPPPPEPWEAAPSPAGSVSSPLQVGAH